MSNIPDQTNAHQADEGSARLASLWKACIAGWRELVAGFGRSIDLMRWGRMRALYHRALGHTLRELEHLVRRAVESDALTRIVSPPRLHRRRRPDRRRTPPASSEDRLLLRAPDRADATTWKVSFRMTPRVYDPARRRYKRKSRPNLDPEAQRPCRGYAFRIEALRRVIVDREAYVMRYARRLARLDEAASARDPILLPDPPDPPDRRPIHSNGDIAEAPRFSTRAQHDPAPWNAKHIEPG
jgi:hypothetical protein